MKPLPCVFVEMWFTLSQKVTERSAQTWHSARQYSPASIGTSSKATYENFYNNMLSVFSFASECLDIVVEK